MVTTDVSKQVMYQTNASNDLVQGILTHRSRLIDGALNTLAGYVPEGSEGCVETVVDILVNLLQHASQQLTQADLEHLRELTEDKVARSVRDETFTELLEDFMSFRDLLAGTYGKECWPVLGIAGLQPATPQELLDRLTKGIEVISKGRNNGTMSPLKPRRRRQRTTWTLEAIEDELRDIHQEMKNAIDSLQLDLHETKGALTHKWKMSEQVQKYYAAVSAIIDGFAILAGEEELRERLILRSLRSSRSRKSDTSEEASAEANATPPSPTDSPNATPAS
ncbi:MAG: hypothetical protein EP343_28485 [Deltaproteobacteria bacterium]|nr:MAG: hypothetical protein EP343_28485 [Deltaproteobacteria bacterium]